VRWYLEDRGGRHELQGWGGGIAMCQQGEPKRSAAQRLQDVPSAIKAEQWTVVISCLAMVPAVRNMLRLLQMPSPVRLNILTVAPWVGDCTRTA